VTGRSAFDEFRAIWRESARERPNGARQRRSTPLWLHVLAMLAVAVAVLLFGLWLLTSDLTSPLSSIRDDQRPPVCISPRR
jgi:type VI protein secretion system component VasF